VRGTIAIKTIAIARIAGWIVFSSRIVTMSMSAALYLVTALALLFAVNRWVTPLPRWSALLLVLIPCCFTGRALITDGLYGPFDLPYEVIPLVSQRGEHGFGTAYNGMVSDLYTQIIPYRKAVHDALAKGEWPLWNPYTLCGEPLAGEAQAAVYSPFTLLALLLPVAKSFTYSATIWFFIAALSAYLFAREIALGELASLFAAAAFMAGAGIVFFILWPLGQTWTLLPFVFLAVRRLEQSPWLLVIALTLVILAGHPESVLHVIALGAAYGLLHMTKRALLHAIIAGALSLGICAIYLMPFMEASKQTEDYSGRKQLYANMKRSVPMSDQMVLLATNVLPEAQQRLWRNHLGNLMRPYSAVAGSIVVALFLYAMFTVRGREKWFFFGMFVFCMLETIRSPIEDVVQRLPLFDIAINDRFSYGAAFAMVVIAAMGLEHLTTRGLKPAPTFGFISIGVLITIVLLRAWIHPMMWPNRENWGTYREFAEIAFLGIAALVAMIRPRLAGQVILACVILQRTVEEGGIIPTFSADVAYPRIPIFDSITKDGQPFRIVGEGMSLLPATNAFYGLEDVRGYSPMTFKRFVRTYDLWCRREPVFVNVVEDLRKPFLSLMNVRYAITVWFVPPPPGWHEVARFRAGKLIENEAFIPRAFVPATAHVGSVEPLMELSLADDLKRDVWIDLKDKPYVRPNGPGNVTITRAKLGYELDANMQHGGWVVVSEAAWPGWRAYVDGRRIRYQFADIAFLGIYVPAGKHHVRLVYWPESFVAGRAISFATLAAIALYFIARRLTASRGKALQLDPSR
jgi:hypothetical protein